MDSSYRITARAGTIVVFILALAGFISIAVGKPVHKDLSTSNQPDRELEDTLIALPSGPGEQYINADSSALNQNSQVAPVYQIMQGVQHQSTMLPQYAPYETVVQNEQASYLKSEQPQQVAQLVGDQSQEYTTLTGLGRQEYATNANAGVNREYPGEIIYVDTSGEAKRFGESDQSSDNKFPTIAEMIYKDSNLPATILTEVPARDMPQEVLERLKKDYGVKVVATRERPGANLVINCDDYTGQEDNICAKPPTTLPLPINDQRSYPLPVRTVDPQYAENDYQGNSGEKLANEQPQIPNGHGRNFAEPQPETYTNRGNQPVGSNESSPPDNERREYQGGYGDRNSASQNENPNHENQDSSAAAEPEGGQRERLEPRPENDSNGFDDSAGEQNNSRNAQQYESRRE